MATRPDFEACWRELRSYAQEVADLGERRKSLILLGWLFAAFFCISFVLARGSITLAVIAMIPMSLVLSVGLYFVLNEQVYYVILRMSDVAGVEFTRRIWLYHHESFPTKETFMSTIMKSNWTLYDGKIRGAVAWGRKK